MRRSISWLLEHRFAVLSLTVFALMCLHTLNGQVGEDFWDHSAVVRELATHPLHPGHPELLLDVPHAFYSPYALVVALISRAAHADAVTALLVAGLFNLVLLFLSLRFFVSSIVPEHKEATAFYALLLTLFGWGFTAWYYSGFFRIGTLGYVLAYPSTFAVGLAFVALGLNKLRTQTRQRIWLVPIFLITVVVLLCHAIAFLFLAVGLVSMPWGEEGKSALPQTATLAALLVLAFLSATLWHYFPLLKLLTNGSDVYHASNADTYRQVLSRLWLSLFGVPLLLIDLRAKWRRPLVIMLAVLTTLYAYGGVSGKYSYGRVIPFVVLLLHIVIAERLAALESWVRTRRPTSEWRGLIVPACVVAVALLLSWEPLRDVLARARPGRQPDYEAYRFLSKYMGQYDVVLSDIRTSWLVPTFGGKIVATLHPVAFVPDQGERWSDVDRFFTAATTTEERWRTIEKYGVGYLLLNKSTMTNWRELQSTFAPTGQLEFESDAFVLISLKPHQRRETPADEKP
jgi:hypothetical protein